MTLCVTRIISIWIKIVEEAINRIFNILQMTNYPCIKPGYFPRSTIKSIRDSSQHYVI